jgi:hypothetical protein
MKTEKQILEKLENLKSEASIIYNSKEDRLREYCQKSDQIKALQWVLDICSTRKGKDII